MEKSMSRRLPSPQPPDDTRAAMIASDRGSFASAETSVVQGSGCSKMPPTVGAGIPVAESGEAFGVLSTPSPPSTLPPVGPMPPSAPGEPPPASFEGPALEEEQATRADATIAHAPHAREGRLGRVPE